MNVLNKVLCHFNLALPLQYLELFKTVLTTEKNDCSKCNASGGNDTISIAFQMKSAGSHAVFLYWTVEN